MNTHAKKLLSLLLALMMLIPAAMAEANYTDALEARIPAITSNSELDISALTEQVTSDNFTVADELTEDTVVYMVEQLYWFYGLFEDGNGAQEWAAPIMELENSYLYVACGTDMLNKLNGKTPDIWAIVDISGENAVEASVIYIDEDTDMMLILCPKEPAHTINAFVEDSGDQYGYGLCFVEDDGETKLSLAQSDLEQNGANYSCTNEAFVIGSPVYTDDGMFIGVANGSSKVYSIIGLLDEYLAYAEGGEEPAEEPVAEPAEEDEPTEESEDVPTAEPEDEPTAAPTKKPTKEPTEEPADAPEEDEDDEPAPSAKGSDDGIDKNMIYGIVAVVVIAGAYFINKRKKDAAKKAEAQPAAPERPKYNAPASTPKYTPAMQDDAVTQPANDIPATVLITPPAAKRTVVGIRCVSGAQAGAVYRLEREVRIGRDPKRCAIIFSPNERGISGLHCSVEPTSDGAIRLTDLGSSYGTFVNGQKLAANTPRILRAGERFQLADGNNRFEVFTEEI